MNRSAPKKEEGRITMDDIRAHLARYGREIPNVLPLVSKADEKDDMKRETLPAAEKKAEISSPGLAPLDTSGLRNALIHNPRDVNSPY